MNVTAANPVVVYAVASTGAFFFTIIVASCIAVPCCCNMERMSRYIKRTMGEAGAILMDEIRGEDVYEETVIEGGDGEGEEQEQKTD